MRHKVFGPTIHDPVFAHQTGEIAWIQQNARLAPDVLAKTFERPGTERITQIAGRTPDGLFENLDIMVGRLDGPTAARSVGQAGQPLGIESMNRLEDGLNRRIPC